MPAQRKREVTIQNKDKNITGNVTKCCDEEAEHKYLRVPTIKTTARAAKFCDVSKTTQKE
jgi:hypothetical protein